MRLLIASTLPLPLILLAGCGAIIEAETKGATAGIASSSSTGSSSTSESSAETTPTGETMTTSATTGETSVSTTTTDPTSATTVDPTSTTDPGTASDSTSSGSSSTGPETTGPACVDSECELGVCINGACAEPPSCLALLEAHDDLVDGPYMIDGDGPGGEAPVEIECDMAEGGWSCVYFNDFENSSEGWSKTDISTCDGAQILGGYKALGKDSPVERFFDLYDIPHAQLRLSGSLYAIDSWDNEELRVELDGVQFWSKKCSVANQALCDHTKKRCGGIFNDGLHHFVATTEHEAIDAVLLFSSSLNQGMDNESFGLDDIRVCIK